MVSSGGGGFAAGSTQSQRKAAEPEAFPALAATGYPEAGAWRIQQVLQEVMLTYLGEHSRQMVDAAIASIKASMSKKERIGVLNDLAELATADGVIVPGEVSFIQQVARYWEVEDELR